jgi:hypothetical protein
MSLIICRTEDLPADAKSCDDLKGRAKYFIQVHRQGRHFYLPVTREMKRLLGLSIRKGMMTVSPKTATMVEDLLRDIISSVYLQVRDTVGEEIHDKLSRQITEGLAGMFDKKLGTAVEGGLNQRLLGMDDLH